MSQILNVGSCLLDSKITNFNDSNQCIFYFCKKNVFLDFGFDKHIYNVLEVNQTGYQQCNDKGFVKNITKGGRDVFNLTEAKQFYFLSSGGYCFHGMKLAVNVVEFMPSPEPVLYENGSPILLADRLGKPSLLYLIFFGLTLKRIL